MYAIQISLDELNDTTLSKLSYCFVNTSIIR